MIKKSLSNPRDSPSNLPGVSGIEAGGAADSDLTAEPRWLLAQRVAQSEVFRHSPRLRGFLLFIVEQTVRDRRAELGEYEIGTRVFERSGDFNPADDSIVRSSARLLRAKLKEYFDGEGSAEPLVIEVPKGGYVPEFVARTPAVAAVPAEAAAPRVERAPAAIYALSAVCVLLLAGCILLWNNRAVPPVRQSGGVSETNLIFSIFAPGAELHLVYGDSAEVIAADRRPSNVPFDEYVRRREGDRIRDAKPAPGEDMAGSRLITSYRDAAFGMRLAESAARQGRILIARHSRLMQARDFRAGNFILLGGVLSNPWSRLFESQLNFRFDTVPAGGQGYGFRNVTPRPGEVPFYRFSAEGPADGRGPGAAESAGLPSGRSATRYARIALTPNLTGTGKVLILAGQSAEGTEGAGDAALARDFPAKVQALLANRDLRDVTSLELLLEVHSVDGAAGETRILAYRVR
jgi:hypothetical protein